MRADVAVAERSVLDPCAVDKDAADAGNVNYRQLAVVLPKLGMVTAHRSVINEYGTVGSETHGDHGFIQAEQRAGVGTTLDNDRGGAYQLLRRLPPGRP